MAYVLERAVASGSDIPVMPFETSSLSLGEMEIALHDRNLISRALALRDLRGPTRCRARTVALPIGGDDASSSTLIPSHIDSIREYVDEAHGEGYWDLFHIGPGLFVSITDATYRRDTWISVRGDAMLKLRIVLRGRLLDSRQCRLQEGPSASLAATTAQRDHGYFLTGRIAHQLVIVHATAGAIATALGMPLSSLPPPLGDTAGATAPSGVQPVHLTPEIYRAASDLRNSRGRYDGAVRRALIEAKCRELLCLLIQQLKDVQTQRTVVTSLSTRDVNRIYEAREILERNFASPPSIPNLARAVGINQTKLKLGFREIVGCTIFDFVQSRRMDKAAELLLRGGLRISEIARIVGYNYPANFTYAFRRHYGFLPKEMRRA